MMFSEIGTTCPKLPFPSKNINMHLTYINLSELLLTLFIFSACKNSWSDESENHCVRELIVLPVGKQKWSEMTH